MPASPEATPLPASLSLPSRRQLLRGAAAGSIGSALAGGTLVGCATTGAGAGSAAPTGSGPISVYFGTYTSKDSKSRGIYRGTLDRTSGALIGVELAAETADPSYLALSVDGKTLYAVNELMELGGERSGGVESFAIDPATRALTRKNQQPTGGGAPCHLALDRSGRALVVANYMGSAAGGNTASYPLQPDGSIGPRATLFQHEGKGPDARRQEAPHAHATMLDPGGKRMFVCDLGTDRILAFTVSADGQLTLDETAGGRTTPGAGPRHIAFAPSGRFAYVNNELVSSVTVFAHDAGTGALTEVETLTTLPADYAGSKSTAQVLLTPDGRWLYVSNRGHDSLAIYGVDAQTGRLTVVGHQPTGGKTPRDFGIDPSGAFLLAANQGSDTVQVFRIDPASGRLAPVGTPVAMPRPVCVLFANK
jgi:6-phosphogluconolactonase